MATLLTQGCITDCGYCRSRFSFLPNEVTCYQTHIPAGYSPEEEAYDKACFSIRCPNCKRSVDVEHALGSDAKRELAARLPKGPEIDLDL